MDQGIDLGKTAAQGLIERDPVLGGLAVLLILAILAMVFFGSRIIVKKDAKIDSLFDRLIATEQKHQADIKLVNDQRSEEIATLAKFRDLLAAREK